MSPKRHRTKCNIILGAISVLLALITIIVTIFGIKYNEDIAERSGSFNKPIACLQIGNYNLKENEILPVYYGFHFDTSDVLLARLPLSIENIGQKTLNNLTITIRYPEIANMAVEEEFLISSTAGVYIDEYKRVYSRIAPFEYISIYLSRINPGQSIAIGEILNIRDTFFSDNISINNGAEYNISLTYAIKIDISVSAENIPTKDYQIAIAAHSSNTLEELSAWYIKHVNLKAQDFRKSMALWSYLYHIFHDIEVNEVLIYPSVNIIETPVGAMYFASKEEQDKIRIVSYKKAQLSLLF